ncbi:MAG: PEP-CTERM sorting domain-containing protein [Okeania sp. SIO3B5]|uniref:PEP-CTERM sorting domain-containing protein n=1 Tax=Okeania sp. SIO3B5 TaxID=2607811 RepID=UPI0013FF30AD|nr:PEP-CTERM sorting domain-containing protein [Okeania sp. SIO3B5]NEO53818.1 PEP-CTERM sorting domain-containing protein [Okeania sp. SIO3B5]
MKNQIVASIAALPFALGTAFAGAEVANAAGLYGRIGFNGFFTNITLSEGELSFNPNPGDLIASVTTGNFVQFNAATIQGPLTFDGSGDSPFEVTSVTNPFLDLGTFGDSDTSDGVNTFALHSGSTITVTDSNGGAQIMLDLNGWFTDEFGHQTKGIGNITFQMAGVDAEYVEGIFDGTIQPIEATFSGEVIGEMKPVPEPTALFGLGVVTAGLVTSRRQKNS